MAHLVPYPFGRLVARVMRELEGDGPVLDVPREKFVRGPGHQDWSVRMHGARAATPYGPAAGPQTQLAQNFVLGYLTGARIFELKTVQIQDELVIPRPCIDVRTVGYNVEWSQELKLEQSLEEYVKASMLLEMVAASGRMELEPGFEAFLFDMSVGYDLAGIQSARVGAFLDGMLDATNTIDRLRAEIPREWRPLADLPFRSRLSSGITLSTFHGCPPKEIEGIVRHLLEAVGVHCIVKLNPTLNGPGEARRIMNDVLGYGQTIPDSAFANDPTFDEACAMMTRLESVARATGLGLGVKFSNTLVVENPGDFLPKREKLAYLSGAPLHVLATTLVDRFRGVFGDRLPISFSAGIDRKNFPDAVALGLVPVTVCTDLLRPGGYSRAHGYFQELAARMDAVGARSVDEWVLRAFGTAPAALEKVPGIDAGMRERCLSALAASANPAPSPRSSAGSPTPVPPRAALARDGSRVPASELRSAAGERWNAWLGAARVLNAQGYSASLFTNPRYTAAQNAKPPKKVGSRLELFDCLACDKCVPVCPNHANFAYVLPKTTVPVVKLTRARDGSWTRTESAPIVIEAKAQYANFADFCNECGNCDVFCPEDGGPYVLKPRFFGSRAQWERWTSHDGFFVTPDLVLGRFAGRAYELERREVLALFRGPDFEIEIEEQRPDSPLAARADPGTVVDLTFLSILLCLREAVLGAQTTYVNA